jgi:stage V sporulation protein K
MRNTEHEDGEEREGGSEPMEKGAPQPPRRDALADLDKLIGLDEVKNEIRRTVALLNLDRERIRQGMPRLAMTHHLVFTGNPGTGKTTVARIVGQIYKDIGFLKSGHLVQANRADLVAEYIGQTAMKTQGVIDTAMDGVLFIDEPYSLVPDDKGDDYGREAVITLIKAMEDNRDRLAVIVAGGRAEMKRFIDSNPGLQSRFKTVIDFRDYDTESLFRIFVLNASEAKLRLSVDAQQAVMRLMESMESGKKGFGNGRTVRNIFEECLARMAERLERSRGKKIDISIFEAEDIPRPGEKVFD